MKQVTPKVPELRFPEFSGEWEDSKLLEVTDFQEGPGILAKDFKKEGVPLVRLNDLSDKEVRIDSGIYLDPKKIDQKWKHFLLREGDLLLSTSGTLGSVSEVDKTADGAIAYTGIIRFRMKSSVVKNFFKQFLITKNFQKQVYSLSTGVAIHHFGPTHLRQMNIIYPSKVEQQKIASFLMSVDEKIEKLEKKKELLEEYKKGVMQKIFSQEIRFKDNDGKDFPEWKEKKLQTVIVQYTKKSKNEDEYPVLTSSHNGLMLQSDYYNNDNRILNRSNIGFNILPKGYITYRSRSDNRRFTFNLNKLDTSGLISTYYPVFTAKNGSNKFIVEYLNFERNYIGRFSEGTSQTVLSYNIIKNMKFELPSEYEQQKIAEFLSEIDKKIKITDQKLKQTKKFKKGLLQKMFI